MPDEVLNLQVLSDRLERLERRIDNLSNATAGSPYGSDRVVLRDAQGRPRGLFEVTEDGPSFTLLDTHAVPRLELCVSEDKGPYLWLRDAQGTIRVALGIGEHGPALGLCDEEEADRLWLRVGKDGEFLYMQDASGALRAGLVSDAAGNAGLTVLDGTGSSRATLAIQEDLPQILLEIEGSPVFAKP